MDMPREATATRISQIVSQSTMKNTLEGWTSRCGTGISCEGVDRIRDQSWKLIVDTCMLETVG